MTFEHLCIDPATGVPTPRKRRADDRPFPAMRAGTSSAADGRVRGELAAHVVCASLCRDGLAARQDASRRVTPRPAGCGVTLSINAAASADAELKIRCRPD